MAIYSPDALRALKDQLYYPYCHLSDSGIVRLEEAVRLFPLKAGESLSIKGDGGWHFLSLLKGRVAVAGPGARQAQLSPADTRDRPYTVRPRTIELAIDALEDSLVCYGDGGAMDYLLSWDELARSEDAGLDSGALDQVRRSMAFRRLPLESVEEAFRRMRRCDTDAGQEICRQGEPHDTFHLIVSGRAEIWEMGLYDDAPLKTGELGPGDAFGEDALVGEATSGMTVRMIEAGQLLCLTRADFRELISNPMIREVEAPLAKAMLEAGHKLVDVRYEEEHEEGHIPGAILLPLVSLRRHWNRLDPADKHVVYCRSGKRSLVAALLLAQRGIEAVSLKGGILDWPYAVTTGA